MKIRLSELRTIIRNVLAEELSPASTGKEIKGTAASTKAVEKVEKNPAIKAAMDKITDAQGLADLVQGILSQASEKGIDQSELNSAISKVKSAASSAGKSGTK
jgi:hypothetical protein